MRRTYFILTAITIASTFFLVFSGMVFEFKSHSPDNDLLYACQRACVPYVARIHYPDKGMCSCDTQFVQPRSIINE